ncbi:hypothetical protein K3495_g4688 [Podosphaera aphanis]|nr:hypothetical protein K3495_g4688 [Podosphaera aphanis]
MLTKLGLSGKVSIHSRFVFLGERNFLVTARPKRLQRSTPATAYHQSNLYGPPHVQLRNRSTDLHTNHLLTPEALPTARTSRGDDACVRHVEATRREGVRLRPFQIVYTLFDWIVPELTWLESIPSRAGRESTVSGAGGNGLTGRGRSFSHHVYPRPPPIRANDVCHCPIRGDGSLRRGLGLRLRSDVPPIQASCMVCKALPNRLSRATIGNRAAT